jgi:hypothetical protein
MFIYLLALFIAVLAYGYLYKLLKQYNCTEHAGFLFLVLLATGPLFTLYSIRIIANLVTNHEFLEYLVIKKEYSMIYTIVLDVIKGESITPQLKLKRVKSTLRR